MYFDNCFIHSQCELISLRLISSRASPYHFKSCFANLCKHNLLSPFELALLIANLNFQGCIAVYLSRYIVAFDRNKVNVTTLFCGCQQLFQTFHRFFQAVLTWTFSRWNYILTLFIFNVNRYFMFFLHIYDNYINVLLMNYFSSIYSDSSSIYSTNR